MGIAAGNIADAFRTMAQGKHIGKIAVKFDNQTISVLPHPEQDTPIKPGATYLITGGTSGFGLVVAQWLADQGAGRIILASRRGPTSEEAKSVIASIREKGILVDTPKTDISDRQAVIELIDTITLDGDSLRGIFHGAMVLDDGFIRDMHSERFAKVMAPKVLGALNLYELTKSMELDFFVLFSSIASLAGNAGQANYIAANSFLDAFAHNMANLGIPVIGINWGVLADIGVAARNQNVTNLLASEGIIGITNQEALNALGHLLAIKRPQIGVLNVDWQRWADAGAHRMHSSRFKELLDGNLDQREINDNARKIRNELADMSADEQQQHVESILRNNVAKILKLTPSKISVNRDIGALGIDSLMFMELAILTKDTFGINISNMELMKHPVISDLAAVIITQLLPQSEQTANQPSTLN